MIRKLREALSHSARSPHHIRTAPMKGYALITEVTPVSPANPQSKPLRRQHWFPISVGLLAVGLLAAIVGLFPSLSSQDEPIGQIELLTRMRGSEVSPDYNPAENRLIFSHRGNKDDFLQFYVKDLNTQASVTTLQIFQKYLCEVILQLNHSKIAVFLPAPIKQLQQMELISGVFTLKIDFKRFRFEPVL